MGEHIELDLAGKRDQVVCQSCLKMKTEVAEHVIGADVIPAEPIRDAVETNQQALETTCPGTRIGGVSVHIIDKPIRVDSKPSYTPYPAIPDFTYPQRFAFNRVQIN